MTHELTGLSCIVAASALEGAGQLLLKRAAAAQSEGSAISAGLRSIQSHPAEVASGLACFAIEIILFSIALRLLPVGVAFPLGSLAFVSVILLSKYFLKESIGSRRAAGVALILAGAMLIGLS